LSQLFRRKVGEAAAPTSDASLRRTLGVTGLTVAVFASFANINEVTCPAASSCCSCRS
jgi:hypothetical protein